MREKKPGDECDNDGEDSNYAEEESDGVKETSVIMKISESFLRGRPGNRRMLKGGITGDPGP